MRRLARLEMLAALYLGLEVAVPVLSPSSASSCCCGNYLLCAVETLNEMLLWYSVSLLTHLVEFVRVSHKSTNTAALNDVHAYTFVDLSMSANLGQRALGG